MCTSWRCKFVMTWIAMVLNHLHGQILAMVKALHCGFGNSPKWKKKVLRESQTLRAKNFRPAADPITGAQDRQNLIRWRWSLPAPTDPVWWRSMHAISSYWGNRHHPPGHPHTQTGPITIHCAARLSARCKYAGQQTNLWPFKPQIVS